MNHSMSRRAPLTGSTIGQFILYAFLLQFIILSGVLLLVQLTSMRALTSIQQSQSVELLDSLVDGWKKDGDTGLRDLIKDRITDPQGPTPVILYARGDGSAIEGNLAVWPTTLPPHTSWKEMELYRVGASQAQQMGLSATALPNGNKLLAGHANGHSIYVRRAIGEALIWSFGASFILSLLSSFLLGRIISNRISKITTTAQAFGDGRFHIRVPSDNSADAFDQLGHAINDMLARIENLLTQLRVMTDGLAHDMRSPVTRMKSTLEQSSLQIGDPAVLAIFERLNQEIDILLRMQSTALLISRAEVGMGKDNFSQVDVGDMLDNLVEIYGPVAEEGGIIITARCDFPRCWPLHRDLMSQALGNLIENSIKYGKSSSRIDIAAKEKNGRLILTVSDNGVGIPEALRATALQRFTRLDASRQTPGSGLGLSLVEATARLHDGSMELADNDPGLAVMIALQPHSARDR